MENMGQSMIDQIINQYKKYRFTVATKNLCYHFLTRQRKKLFGQANPDKTFYVIRGVDSKSPFYIGVELHLLANYFYVISHLKFALENNWIPVVDQQNYPVYNSMSGKVNGIENAWEYFWSQPTRYTLNDVYKSQNVILSKRSWFGQWDMGYDVKNYNNKETISFYYGLSENIHLKQPMADYVNTIYNKAFKMNDRILGVSVRYGSHAKNCYHHGPGHPIAPEIETLIDMVLERYEKWNMSCIFLASDDENAVERFRSILGDRLIVLPRKRFDTGQIYDDVNPNPMYEADMIYETTLNYLIEMELLARCTGLIGSITSGLRYAIVRNNNAYEYMEIVDCGRFADKNRRA